MSASIAPAPATMVSPPPMQLVINNVNTNTNTNNNTNINTLNGGGAGDRGPPQPWKTGLCGCFNDMAICCYGCWCLPCLYGENSSKASDGGSCCCPATLFCLCMYCPWLVCCISGPTRTVIRSKYHLREAPCSDCCVHFWCTCLAVCQEGREIKIRG